MPGLTRIENFAVLLPWYRERDFLILASAAMFLIAFLTLISKRHNQRAAFLSRHDVGDLFLKEVSNRL